MSRKSKDQRLSEVHALALQQFDESFLATKDDREMATTARRFVNVRGAQWDFDVENQFRNKIKMEIDHVSGATNRIKNEYRRNRISASFLPKDGSDADALSDAMASRYRADTQDAMGQEARDMAFDSAVEGGFGGMRLRAELEDHDDTYQCIRLEPINDAESTLFFDVNAKRKDKSDAGHAFLITPWSRRAFVAEYGEECASWPQPLSGKFKFAWFGTGTDLVYVAEYFVKKDATETTLVYTNALTGETEEIEEEDFTEEDAVRLAATGFLAAEPKIEKTNRVRKYVMNGAKVLVDGEVIPGTEIPLVPQYGHRTVISHVERFRGHVVKAMDAQTIYNLQVSKVAETAASSGVEKPIFTSEQIGPYADLWQNDHIANNAFLLINSITDVNGNPQPAGPVGYTKSPDLAPAVAALIQLTKQDIADQLGNPENAEQVQPDQSGVALDLVQGRIDMQAYGYMDNAMDAERRVAEIWMGMASEIYVEKGRKLKTLSEDGKRGQVEIGKPILDEKTGQVRNEVDFSRAEFDVVVDIGPTSASRRSAVVRTVTGLMQVTTDPETALMLMHTAIMNMEGEGLHDVRDYSRKRLLKMGVVQPTKEEEDAMQAEAQAAQPAPDPNAVLAEAMAGESQAKAEKAQADTFKAMAQTKLTEAQTAETLAGIPIAQQKQAVETAKSIMAEHPHPQMAQPQGVIHE